MIKNLVNIYGFLFFLGISLMLLFNRPFVGLPIFNIRIGELLIFSSLLILITLIGSSILKIKIFDSDINKIFKVLYGIVFLFAASIFINNSNVLSSYTYKSSVYIWTIGYLFIGLIFANFQNESKTFFQIYIPLIYGNTIFTLFFFNWFFSKFYNQFFLTHTQINLNLQRLLIS